MTNFDYFLELKTKPDTKLHPVRSVFIHNGILHVIGPLLGIFHINGIPDRNKKQHGHSIGMKGLTRFRQQLCPYFYISDQRMWIFRGTKNSFPASLRAGYLWQFALCVWWQLWIEIAECRRSAEYDRYSHLFGCTCLWCDPPGVFASFNRQWRPISVWSGRSDTDQIVKLHSGGKWVSPYFSGRFIIYL